MSKDLALQQVEWDLHESPEAFIPLEFTEEIKPELYGLEVQQATEISRGLEVAILERKVLIEAYNDIIKLPITPENILIFKELRLKLVKIRTKGLDIWKKNEKAVSIAKNNYVDATYKREYDINMSMENPLMASEKFFENLEKQKAKDLNDARIERLKPYVADVTGLDFAQMNDYDFDDYLLGKKTRFENEQKESEAEALRIETERLAEIERQKAIEVENAKLKAEADKKDAEIAKLKAIENAKIEAERLVKINADKLAKAPIKEQLNKWVESFELPECTVYNATSVEINAKFTAFKTWANNQVKQL